MEDYLCRKPEHSFTAFRLTTSTFVQEAPGVHKGYDYARTGNPTRAVPENLIAKLEKGSRGLAFASGLAAIDAILKLLKSGYEIIAVDDIYDGTFRFFEQVYKKSGIRVTYVDGVLFVQRNCSNSLRVRVVSRA